MTKTALLIYLAELFKLAEQDTYIQDFLRFDVLYSTGVFCNWTYEVFPTLPVHEVGTIAFCNN